MRYVYTIFVVAYAVSGIGAGEVWVVKPKPCAVWVVSVAKATPKTCPCSPACVCGCNEGKPCNCGQPTQTATQWPTQFAETCISGR